MEHDYDDGYDDDRDWGVWALGLGALIVSAAVLWFGVGALTGGDDETAQRGAANTRSTPPATVVSTEAPSSTVDLPESTSVPSTSATTTPSTAPLPPESGSYATLPDGSPVPVLVIFDGELITVSGVVPTEAAVERLRVIALAYNTVPGARVATFVTVDPVVPVGVGVRMIDTSSAPFAEGSPGVSAEYIAQLDRIVVLMNSVPNVTVDVIGHTDQTGDDDVNFELSTQRARGTTDYLTSSGIDPSRLSSRGAGASDLLTLNTDEAALALNRRTEFVYFGLLVDPTQPA